MKCLVFVEKVVLTVALVCLGSCSRTAAPPVQAGVHSVQELRAGCVALEQFAKDLQVQPAENDFQRFAAAPYNYTFQVRETDSSFVFTFTIKPYQGRRVFDGISSYEVGRADMKIVKIRFR
ncbi:hypothetical protein [Dyella sp. Tek66A03]|uniref:hypothetical protein n=1 Tax=Dyella sp. Tek66A03 TaxID=3458298 RepID=UPI00403E9C76